MIYYCFTHIHLNWHEPIIFRSWSDRSLIKLGESSNKSEMPWIWGEKSLKLGQPSPVHQQAHTESRLNGKPRRSKSATCLLKARKYTCRHARNWQDRIFKGVFCDYLWIFYINILSCGVFFEWEADGNFLTRVSGSEKYSIFRAVGILALSYIGGLIESLFNTV